MYHFFTSGSARGGGIGVIKANAERPPSTVGPSSSNTALRTSGSSTALASNSQNAKPTWANLEEICGKCNKPLSGSVAKNKGKVFHASCFTCATCNTQLRGRCMNIDNQAYCEKCGKTAFVKASAAAPAVSSAPGTPGPTRRASISASPGVEEKEAEEKRKRIEKQRELIELEKNRLSQEAEAKARKDAKEQEELARLEKREREEREEATKLQREERARKEREAKEKEAKERVERVRREREEMEREARERERIKEEESARLLAQERQKRAEEAKEREERETRLREKKLEEERIEASAREKEAAQRAAKFAPPRSSSTEPKAETKNETEGMTEWQRIAFQKAKKRTLTLDGTAEPPPASSGTASSGKSPQTPKSPDWRKKTAAEGPAKPTVVSPASHHATKTPNSDRRGAPKTEQPGGVAEWQRKAAEVHNKLTTADQPPARVVESPKPVVEVAKTPEKPRPTTDKTSPVHEPPKPVGAPPMKPKTGSLPGEELPEERVAQTATYVTAEQVEVAIATPMRPSLPPPPRIKTTLVQTPEIEEQPKSPRSPRLDGQARYSVRPPPPVPPTDHSTIKFASFGVCLDEIMRYQSVAFPKEKVPLVWTSLVRMLHSLKGMEQEGIFRMSGSSSDIDRLKDTLNKGAFDVEFTGDAHVVACALKQWISELTEPVVPRYMYETTIAAVEMPGGDAIVMPYIYQSLRELPSVNRDVLIAFVTLMREVLTHSSSNRMTEANLAICFSPGIFQSMADDPAIFVHNTQCETQWVELLLRHPPKHDDLNLERERPRLVAPVRDLSLSLNSPGSGIMKRKGSYLGSRGSGATSSLPNVALGGAVDARKASTPSAFDAIFQANNNNSSNVSDGSVESVSNYIVKGETLQGYLMKENPNGLPKLWKRRWFQLQGKRLLYGEKGFDFFF
jgi:hypothetical protein